METRSTAAAIPLLMRLNRTIYRFVDEAQLGMTLKQFSMLNLLRDFDGSTQGHLADAMCMDANTVVLLLNALEERGFAVRERDPDDRRRHIVRTTKAGLKALVAAEQALENVTDDVLGSLDEDERTALRGLMAKALGEGALALTADG